MARARHAATIKVDTNSIIAGGEMRYGSLPWKRQVGQGMSGMCVWFSERNADRAREMCPELRGLSRMKKCVALF